MRFEGVVVCESSDVDVLVPVHGVPLLVRAVKGLLGAGEFTRVHVLLDAPRTTDVVDACRGLPVEVCAHALQLSVGARGDASNHTSVILGDPVAGIAVDADAMIIHDAARGLAPAQLTRGVIDRLRTGPAAVVPVMPLSDTVKIVDGEGVLRGTPDRAALRVVQTPFAVRSAALSGLPPVHLLRAPGALAAAGADVVTMPGHPDAIAIRTARDVEAYT
jgi:2-C-methyl-D-erythritol 4-phosphate cytidylyltransferase